MTLHVPLSGVGEGSMHTHIHTHTRTHKPTANLPSSGLPPFVNSSTTPDAHLNAVFDSILKAKRITVVCGAGISVEAGIPDFRSPDGLFQSLKRDNPKESLTSGKDLFDASIFKSTEKTALFCRMIASLASLSSQSEPTAFHSLLRTLDDRGQLLRVYTQNIDALEMKAGLSFGVPEFEERFLRGARRVGKAKAKAKAKDKSAGNVEGVEEGVKKEKTKAKTKAKKDVGSGLYSYTPRKGKKKALLSNNTGGLEAGPSHHTLQHEESLSTNSNAITPVPISHPPLNTIPRCIPLHGTLLSLHCQHCTQTFPLHPPPPESHTVAVDVTPPHSRSSSSSPDPSLPLDRTQNHNPTSPLSSPSPSSPSTNNYTLHTLLSQGTPPPCPSCTSLEQTRALVGKRLRGVGKLRPSVVLYGEEHREGESVGEAVRRDLCGIEVEVADKAEAESEIMDVDVVGPEPEPEPKAAPGLESTTPPTLPLPLPLPLPHSLSRSTPHVKKTRSRRITGKGPDLLLVVGTSLRVPGTKRIVREFSKAVRSLNSSSKSSSGGASSTANTSTTPSPTQTPTLATAHLPTPPPPHEHEPHIQFDTSTQTPTQTPTKPPGPRTSSSSSKSKADSNSKREPKFRTIYLNKEFPSPAREWEDVFDVWVQGDAQVFARGVDALIAARVAEAKLNGNEEGGLGGAKRKREGGECTPKKRKKRRKNEDADADAGAFLLTPPGTVRRPAKMKLKMKEEESDILMRMERRTGASLNDVASSGSVSAWSAGEEEQEDEEETASSVVLDADADVDADVDVEEFEDSAIRTLMEMETHSLLRANRDHHHHHHHYHHYYQPHHHRPHPGFQMRRLTDMDMEIVPETESECDTDTWTDWDRADADASCVSTLQLEVDSRPNSYMRGYGHNGMNRMVSPAPTPPPPQPQTPPFTQKDRKTLNAREREREREREGPRSRSHSVVTLPPLLYSRGLSAGVGSSLGSRTTGGGGIGDDPFLVLDREMISPGVVGDSFGVHREHQGRTS